jgi:RNA polymerase sigma-70 factor (ECF subfamily)
MSEQELLEERRIIERSKIDPEAFGFLYEKYYEQIFLFVERRVADRDTAGDLTSQVFLKAMMGLPKYEFRGFPFSSWLYRIASNQVNEYYRGNKHERIISLEDGGLQKLIAEAEEDAPTDPLPLLSKLLQELAPDEVQLLELRFFEERPFKEVSYILGITENNAKVRAYRIIEKLKKIASQYR